MNFSDALDEHQLVNDWLASLGAPARLALRLDEEGVCALSHINGVDCAIEVPEGCGKVYLRAALIPNGASSDGVLRHCMSCHFLGIQTGGATFATDPDDDSIVLWQSRELATLTSETFAIMVVDFFETAAHWKEHLRVRPDRAPGQAPLSPADFPIQRV